MRGEERKKGEEEPQRRRSRATIAKVKKRQMMSITEFDPMKTEKKERICCLRVIALGPMGNSEVVKPGSEGVRAHGRGPGPGC